MIAKIALAAATCATLLTNGPVKAGSFHCLTRNVGGLMSVAMGDYNPYLTPISHGTLYVATYAPPGSVVTVPPQLGTLERPLVFGPEGWTFEVDPATKEVQITAANESTLLTIERSPSIAVVTSRMRTDGVAIFDTYRATRVQGPTAAWTKCYFEDKRLDARTWDLDPDFGDWTGWPGRPNP